MHVSGTVCTVQEAAFILQKPSEILGRETDYVQTVYLQTNEKFWYNWRYREAIEELGEEAWGHLPYGFSPLVVQLLEPCSLIEKVSKAGNYSYKSEGKKVSQEAMFPDLRKEIDEKLKALKVGLRWPDKRARHSEDYKSAMKAACVKDGEWKIGGDTKERE